MHVEIITASERHNVPTYQDKNIRSHKPTAVTYTPLYTDCQCNDCLNYIPSLLSTDDESVSIFLHVSSYYEE
jgi:hypothetical protein